MNEESSGPDLAEINAHPLIRLLAEITAHRQSLELAGRFDLAEIDAGLQKLGSCPKSVTGRKRSDNSKLR